MSYSLLLDFGATRIKSALLDDNTGQIQHVLSRPCTQAICKGDYFEIPITGLTQDFLCICNEYTSFDFTRIFMCSQMHGFVLCDEHQHFLTDYISWQDERALRPVGQEPSSWELFSAAFSATFKDITGMRLRNGFPVVKVLNFLRLHTVNYIKVLSLPEALLLAGKPTHQVHVTMAAGSGMINFETQQPDENILDFLSQHTATRTQIDFNTITNEIIPSGTITLSNREILVYTAIGDHQCAVLGAGNTQETLSFNLGTGSQVTAICQRAPNSPDTERRHFLNGQEFQTITHIPAGRVLAALMNFYQMLTGRDGWERFTAVSLAQVQQAKPRFDLAFFKDAWHYTHGGGVTGLQLTDLNESVLWADLFRSFAQQYVCAAGLFHLPRKTLILSGGKLAKLPVLADFLKQELKMAVRVSAQTDETLLGLAMLAKSIK